ncbi:MAG TPA: S8 family serine peptidase, partial [Actinomycetota bacterium]|nr:S8 family serine peptidase [Actinomycetota bacterium]
MRRFFIVACAAVVVMAAAPPVSARAPVVNDIGYDTQWGLHIIEAERAWTRSVGRDVVVAIVDTGVDDEHPDLRGRVLVGYDFADDDEDADDDNGHGTLIAGIVAARTGNRIGVASVAPQAKILPVRVLGKKGSGSSRAVARGIRFAVAEGADVINLSLAQESGLEASGSIVPTNVLSDPSVDEAIRD